MSSRGRRRGRARQKKFLKTRGKKDGSRLVEHTRSPLAVLRNPLVWRFPTPFAAPAGFSRSFPIVPVEKTSVAGAAPSPYHTGALTHFFFAFACAAVRDPDANALMTFCHPPAIPEISVTFTVRRNTSWRSASGNADGSGPFFLSRARPLLFERCSSRGRLIPMVP